MKKTLLSMALLSVAGCNAVQVVQKTPEQLDEELRLAVRKDDAHEVKLLTQQGADPNRSNALNISVAGFKGPKPETLKALLDAGARLNEPVDSPALINILMFIRRFDEQPEDHQILELLLNEKYRGNINQTNSQGQTILDLLDQNYSSTSHLFRGLLEEHGARRSGQPGRIERLRGYHEREIQRQASQ